MVIPIGTGFTTKAILAGEKPVLLVVHSHDGTWQFLDGDPIDIEEAIIVHSDHILRRAGMMPLLDLPTGCEAERASVEDPWIWFKISSDNETRQIM